ncbi:TPA: TraE/TraK family type IV conjugative transfer system protein [Legionella pneumophila]|uniref:TraE/TraK family type IV conjugative transfer system protein n=1 Tax=Legionella pneumophila TaxID=446 RepID=UPI000770820C|nr:TraE/TraK family type IV conjugative transfer system protein [Legionella pneumophila]PQM70125.1 conjugal transfer protein TraE [Legionella pneumophila]CZL46416.1 conjugal transfer pilus assembly protein TraE [Legionella pneumophila]HAT7045834.1 conjugal transfer protein TraE [Legionella pneumophila]HAU0301371.1 conjugal transfer protein TraE [Legionella pneumophila]HAU1397581.1 conjugal transfer protein TraE [Legionella pneumophila]
MDTSFRDNAIAKNRLLFKLTLIWALSSTFAVIVLCALNFYTLLHKQVHWLPVCTGLEFSIGDKGYSPEYLKEMTQKAADLRLTYNPETIDARYTMLSHLIPAKYQESFSKLLDAERKTVHDKNVSSVFYAEKVSVDVTKNQGQIEGQLHRTSHGLQLKPQHKMYRVQFSHQSGLLNLVSIQEIHHE